MLGKRPDATLAEGVSNMRRFLSLLSPRRNDSVVYFSQDVDVEAAFEFLETVNRDRPATRPVTLFHLVIRAFVKTLDRRPRLNRFTIGGRIWQRDGIWISFSAKKSMDEAAPVTTVKLRLEPGASLFETVDRIYDQLEDRRSDRESTSDKEVSLLLRLPPALTRLAIGFAHLVDRWGLLPRAMIDSDPMYASVFLVNLGSVGLDAGYHHLFEHGNTPIFCVMGRVQETEGRRRCTMKYSYDERVEDGLYCARSLELMHEYFAKPRELT